jgi:hypothetical protein
MSIRSISILVLSFSIVIALIGNIGSSYEQTDTHSNSDQIMPTATDNNAFSDLSRNATLNGQGTGP